MVSAKTPLGQVGFSVRDLAPEEPKEEWFPLSPVIKGEKVSGALHVRLLFLPPTVSTFNP